MPRLFPSWHFISTNPAIKKTNMCPQAAQIHAGRENTQTNALHEAERDQRTKQHNKGPPPRTASYFSEQHSQSNNQNPNHFQYKRYADVCLGKCYNKWHCRSKKRFFFQHKFSLLLLLYMCPPPLKGSFFVCGERRQPYMPNARLGRLSRFFRAMAASAPPASI